MGIDTSVYSTPPPSRGPELSVKTWLVLECTNGKRYLVGWCIQRHEGRASTEILDFDADAMWVRTLSGRVYALIGAPGIDPDAIYVWSRYARVNGYVFARDVTVEYWPGWVGSAEVTYNKIAALAAALGARDG